jgi:putative SOS response-associated peptidase YedK
MINARAETVDTKPAYRNAFKQRRCLIPAEGFYEWKAEERGKTPYLIRRSDGAPFAMAGLWETWKGPDGAPLESCTVVVTDANALLRALHDRMPVVLAPEDYAAWLDPGNQDAAGVLTMLRSAEPAAWQGRQVSRKVNSPKNDSPDLLEPVGARERDA